jgi:hypothetical protein
MRPDKPGADMAIKKYFAGLDRFGRAAFTARMPKMEAGRWMQN